MQSDAILPIGFNLISYSHISKALLKYLQKPTEVSSSPIPVRPDHSNQDKDYRNEDDNNSYSSSNNLFNPSTTTTTTSPVTLK